MVLRKMGSDPSPAELKRMIAEVNLLQAYKHGSSPGITATRIVVRRCARILHGHVAIILALQKRPLLSS